MITPTYLPQPSLPMNGEIGPGLGHVLRPHLLLRSELAEDAVVPLRLEVLDEAQRVDLRTSFYAVDESGLILGGKEMVMIPSINRDPQKVVIVGCVKSLPVPGTDHATYE